MGFAQGEEKVENAGYLISKGNKSYEAESYEEAIKYYEKAIKLDPKNAIAHYNWGLALYSLAQDKKDNEREDLLNKSFEKYEEAVRLYKTNTEKAPVYYNWGLALYNLAQDKKNNEREDLLNSAFEKYEKTTQLDPKNAPAFHYCGVTLLELAKIRQDCVLFENAFEKYEEAVQLYKADTDKAAAYFNWGIALYNLAEIKQNENLFKMAFEKYKETVRLYKTDADKAPAYYNWGLALSKLAEINKDKDSFEKAFEKYKEAVRLYKTNVGKISAYYSWGIALYNLAEINEDKNLFKSASERFGEVTKLDQKDATAFYYCGIVLSKLAEINKDEDSFEKAFEQYKEAVRLYETDTDKAFVYFNWGLAFYAIAEIKQDEKLYRKAEECFIKSKQDILSIFVSLCKNNKERILRVEYFYQLLESLDTNDALFFTKITESVREDKIKLNEYKDIYLISIFIISLLHVNNENNEYEKYATHYSKKDVSQKLFFNNSKFRLNAINYSNDPTEGKTLLDFLYGEKNRPSDEKLNTNYEAFASCFTFSYDNLNLFRLYGKESDKEGTGLSLVFRNNFFSTEAKMSVGLLKIDSSEMNNDNSIEKDKLALFRCIYIDPNPETKQPVVTVGQKEEYLFYREKIEDKFKEYSENKMKDIIEQIKYEMNELKILANSDGINSEIVGQLLLNLRYLVKHIAFKEEQECRMVKIFNLSKDKKKIKDDDFKQMYFEYPFAVPMYIDKIYFGPKAIGYELFKSMLKYKGLNDIRCDKSTNPLA